MRKERSPGEPGLPPQMMMLLQRLCCAALGAGLNTAVSILVGKINQSRGRDKRPIRIQFLMGAIGGLCAGLFSLCAHTVSILFLSQILCEASLRDQKEHRMEDAFWICVLALSLARLPEAGPMSFLFGGAAAFVPLMLVRLIGKKNGIGGADIKMAGALGTFAPPLWSSCGLILSCGLALIVQKIRKKKGKDGADCFAMIPYLSIGMGTVCLLLPYLKA